MILPSKDILDKTMQTNSTTTSPIKISVQEVTKSFGSKAVLSGVNLEVELSDSMIIIGGSGTGKSVLLKCILGLETPDSGDILIDGKSILSMNTRQREEVNDRIGMLFQYAALFDSLSVWENVAFGLIQGKNMARKIARDIAVERLADVGLGSEVIELSPAELSGGMRKRVGLARAIASNPEILFFDEPTTGLDPIMGHIIDDLIVKVVSKIGATGLTITHDMVSAKRISTKLAMLYQGKILWTGATHEIEQTDNPYVQQFITGNINGPISMSIKKL